MTNDKPEVYSKEILDAACVALDIVYGRYEEGLRVSELLEDQALDPLALKQCHAALDESAAEHGLVGWGNVESDDGIPLELKLEIISVAASLARQTRL